MRWRPKNRRYLPFPRSFAATIWLVAMLAAGSAIAQGAEVRWKGVIAGSIEFVVTFTPVQGGGFGGTLDIPAQGLSGSPLTDVVYTDTDIAFTLPIAPPDGATVTATRDEEGTRATGQLEQGGNVAPVTMEMLRAGDSVGPERPQTPQPPFPYQEREVSYANAADGTRLAGTLTIPQGDGPFPAVVMITGSGAQDRDATMLGHKPFWVIADHLTRHGVAVLRADDRGVGASSGNISESSPADFAGDALAGIAHLQRQAEIDAERIGIIGHSEGGLVAPIAAARSTAVAYVVLLAGPGIPGRELMPLQLATIARAAGRSEDNIAAQVTVQEALLDLAIASADRQAIYAGVEELLTIQLAAIPAAQRPPQEQLAPGIAAQADQLMNRWFRSFLVEDPRRSLRRVTCPVLALNGSLDLQVPSQPNLAEIERALAEAGNDDVTVRELAGLNHLFQSAGTGSPAEYGALAETFAPRALDVITEWIRARTQLAGAARRGEHAAYASARIE